MEPLKNTILVVDDEAAIRRLVCVALEKAGYAVLDAADGEQALEIFRHEGPNIKLILSDVRMPKLDGVNLADEVLQIQPGLPVLFMSGNSTNVSRGFGCVSKPFTTDQLIGRIRQILTEVAVPLST